MKNEISNLFLFSGKWMKRQPRLWAMRRQSHLDHQLDLREAGEEEEVKTKSD